MNQMPSFVVCNFVFPNYIFRLAQKVWNAKLSNEAKYTHAKQFDSQKKSISTTPLKMNANGCGIWQQALDCNKLSKKLKINTSVTSKELTENGVI